MPDEDLHLSTSIGIANEPLPPIKVELSHTGVLQGHTLRKTTVDFGNGQIVSAFITKVGAGPGAKAKQALLRHLGFVQIKVEDQSQNVVHLSVHKSALKQLGLKKADLKDTQHTHQVLAHNLEERNFLVRTLVDCKADPRQLQRQTLEQLRQTYRNTLAAPLLAQGYKPNDLKELSTEELSGLSKCRQVWDRVASKPGQASTIELLKNPQATDPAKAPLKEKFFVYQDPNTHEIHYVQWGQQATPAKGAAEFIGEGAAGVAQKVELLATKGTDGTSLAMKTARNDDEARAGVQKEAGILKKLHEKGVHEGIMLPPHATISIDPPVHDENGELVTGYITVQYAGDLTKLPQEVTSTQKLEMARQLCSGLAHCASKGLLHSDIKPGNIYYSKEDDGSYKAYLADFGESRWQGDVKASFQQNKRYELGSASLGYLSEGDWDKFDEIKSQNKDNPDFDPRFIEAQKKT